MELQIRIVFNKAYKHITDLRKKYTLATFTPRDVQVVFVFH